MALTLRTMNRHAQLMGWSTDRPREDYVVLDDERSVGRINPAQRFDQIIDFDREIRHRGDVW
jgi:hypothetical protein